MVGFESRSVPWWQNQLCGQNSRLNHWSKHAEEIGAKLLMVQRDFDLASMESVQWNYPLPSVIPDGQSRNRTLPFPALRGAYQLSNAACALTVLECLNEQLPVDIGAIKRGLLLVENPGRFQVLPGRPLVVWMSANPHAARALRRSLINLALPKTYCCIRYVVRQRY